MQELPIHICQEDGLYRLIYLDITRSVGRVGNSLKLMGKGKMTGVLSVLAIIILLSAGKEW